MRKIALLVTLLLEAFNVSRADPFTDRMGALRSQFVRQFQIPTEWRFEAADITNAEQPDFDDSSWQKISPRFSWTGTNTVWFRSTVSVPSTVGAQSAANLPLILELGITNQGD